MTREREDDMLASFISSEKASPEEVAGQDEMRDRLAASLAIPMPAPTPPPALTEEIAKHAITATSRVKALVILAVGFGVGFATVDVLGGTSRWWPTGRVRPHRRGPGFRRLRDRTAGHEPHGYGHGFLPRDAQLGDE